LFADGWCGSASPESFGAVAGGSFHLRLWLPRLRSGNDGSKKYMKLVQKYHFITLAQKYHFICNIGSEIPFYGLVCGHYCWCSQVRNACANNNQKLFRINLSMYIHYSSTASSVMVMSLVTYTCHTKIFLGTNVALAWRCNVHI
jgi:hypothetical protein